MRAVLFLLPALLAAQTSPTKTAPPKTAPAKPAAAPAAVMTDEQKTIYSLGLQIYRSLGQFDLSPAELDLVKRGITDAAAGKPKVDASEFGPKIQALQQSRAGRVTD